MKTVEELAALRKEAEAMKVKLSELAEEEMKQVCGGWLTPGVPVFLGEEIVGTPKPVKLGSETEDQESDQFHFELRICAYCEWCHGSIVGTQAQIDEHFRRHHSQEDVL